jgi:hypothetical protein
MTHSERLTWINEEIKTAYERCSEYPEEKTPVNNGFFLTPQRYLELLLLDRDNAQKGHG